MRTDDHLCRNIKLVHFSHPYKNCQRLTAACWVACLLYNTQLSENDPHPLEWQRLMISKVCGMGFSNGLKQNKTEKNTNKQFCLTFILNRGYPISVTNMQTQPMCWLQFCPQFNTCKYTNCSWDGDMSETAGIKMPATSSYGTIWQILEKNVGVKEDGKVGSKADTVTLQSSEWTNGEKMNLTLCPFLALEWEKMTIYV